MKKIKAVHIAAMGLIRVTADIETSMDGTRWMQNKLSTQEQRVFNTDVESWQDVVMQHILDLYETCRILGFEKIQFINALPEFYRAKFRNEIAKIRNDKHRVIGD